MKAKIEQNGSSVPCPTVSWIVPGVSTYGMKGRLDRMRRLARPSGLVGGIRESLCLALPRTGKSGAIIAGGRASPGAKVASAMRGHTSQIAGNEQTATKMRQFCKCLQPKHTRV